MFIHEMTADECRQALRKSTVGRLGCALNDQPYVVPIYFAFDGQHLYGFTTVGQKIEWMRANPKVCLEVDERTNSEEWMSIIVFGHYEELPDEPHLIAARAKAHQLLQQRVMWWEPAYMSKAHREGYHSLVPVFYRLHIVRMSGHRATPDSPGVLDTPTLIPKKSWVDSICRHIGMKN